MSMEFKTCVTCGKTILRIKYHDAKSWSKAKYCSWQCRKWVVVIKKCVACGKNIDFVGRKVCDYKKIRHCSVRCMNVHRPHPKMSHTRAYMNNYVKTHINSRFSMSKSNAKRRGLKWELSIESYSLLMSMPCYYCGGELSKLGVGLDRIDNALGYIKGNVVPCCSVCNVWRADKFTSEETKVAMDAIKQFRESKKEIQYGKLS